MSTYSHLLAARATLQVGEFKPHEPSYKKTPTDRFEHVSSTTTSYSFGLRAVLKKLRRYFSYSS